MKNVYLRPVSVLLVILVCSLWNSIAISFQVNRWQTQLHHANILAQNENWVSASSALSESYTDWSSCQTWLHIVAKHDSIDDAEAMYRRAMAFAATEEPSEFHAEISDLQDQLRLLAEMERFSIRNIL